jgi:hypothetical protein
MWLVFRPAGEKPATDDEKRSARVCSISVIRFHLARLGQVKTNNKK